MKLDLTEDDDDIVGDVVGDVVGETDDVDEGLTIVTQRRNQDRNYTELRRRIELKLEKRRLKEELGIYDEDILVDD